MDGSGGGEDKPVEMPVDRVLASHDEEHRADWRAPGTSAHAVALLETARVCIRMALCCPSTRPLLPHHVVAHVLAPWRPRRAREVVAKLFDRAPLDVGGPGGVFGGLKCLREFQSRLLLDWRRGWEEISTRLI